MDAVWQGSFENLKACLSDHGVKGTWETKGKAQQLRPVTGGVVNWYPSTGKLLVQGKAVIVEKLEATIEAALATTEYQVTASPARVREAGIDPQRIFVVHGHDTQAREQLELILHRLELEPFVLQNTGGGGLTIIEALEREIGPGEGRARFGIVLMTPDDHGYSSADGPEAVQPRSRQNVVLEMGMLLAALGRPNVAILKRGHLEIPSDAQGILYLGFNDHVREVVPRLVDRLREAGFNLSPGAITRAGH